jgi:predicted nucleic acid-binding protein
LRKKLLLYLDLNCFNRPFDDQTQDRVRQETTAVLSILQRIELGFDQLAWSAVLAFENAQHPLPDRRDEIARWGRRAAVIAPIDQYVSTMAEQLNKAGITPLDAAHVACAEAIGCDRLLTCDDRLLRIARAQQLAVVVQNPLEYLEECGHV